MRNASALPVKELGPAIAYYESVMGFTVISRDATTAALQRDGAQIGLVIKRDHQPHEASHWKAATLAPSSFCAHWEWPRYECSNAASLNYQLIPNQ